jgi:hypothetical protein
MSTFPITRFKTLAVTALEQDATRYEEVALIEHAAETE